MHNKREAKIKHAIARHVADLLHSASINSIASNKSEPLCAKIENPRGKYAQMENAKPLCVWTEREFKKIAKLLKPTIAFVAKIIHAYYYYYE